MEEGKTFQREKCEAGEGKGALGNGGREKPGKGFTRSAHTAGPDSRLREQECWGQGSDQGIRGDMGAGLHLVTVL